MLALKFGLSFRAHHPVADLPFEYLPYTLTLVLTASLIQIALGMTTGLFAAAKRGETLDLKVTGLGLLMYAM
jgi:peptide/nickel transport system permease protein